MPQQTDLSTHDQPPEPSTGRRGFLAQPRASLHRWSDPRFDGLLRSWLPGANREMLAEIEAIKVQGE